MYDFHIFLARGLYHIVSLFAIVKNTSNLLNILKGKINNFKLLIYYKTPLVLQQKIIKTPLVLQQKIIKTPLVLQQIKLEISIFKIILTSIDKKRLE